MMKLVRLSLAVVTLVILSACSGDTITTPQSKTPPVEERLTPGSRADDLTQCVGKIIEHILPSGEKVLLCESPHSGSGG